MSRLLRKHLLPWICCVLVCGPGSLPAVPPEVSYNRDSQQLSVEATGQTLQEVLGQLTAQTGWLIFLEPDANPTVTTKFKDVRIGQAIEFLVGRMNYALVPQRDGPTKLFIFQTSREHATLQISAGDMPTTKIIIRRVGNELIVTVEPGTDIEALAKRLGAKVTGHLEGTHTYRLEFEDDAAADSARTELASTPGVKRVENNYYMDRPRDPQMLAGGPHSPLKLSLDPPPADGRVMVGLVDTEVGTLGNGLDKFLIAGKSSAGAKGSADGSLTHGTAMAYAILSGMDAVSGGNTSAVILWEDAYKGQTTTTSWDLAERTVAVINQGANLVVISSGGYGQSEILADVVKNASDKGIPVVVAVGNDSLKKLAFPAGDQGATPVAATRDGRIANYSNFTPDVTIAAPGDIMVYQNTQAFGISGTSPANALAGGVAAGLAVSKNISTAEAVKQLPKYFPVP